jgi:hypothetical protein
MSKSLGFTSPRWDLSAAVDRNGAVCAPAAGPTTVNDLQGESMSCCFYWQVPAGGTRTRSGVGFFSFREIRSFWADTGHCGSGFVCGTHRLVEEKTTNQHLGRCAMHPTTGVVLEPFDDSGQSQFVI